MPTLSHFFPHQVGRHTRKYCLTSHHGTNIEKALDARAIPQSPEAELRVMLSAVSGFEISKASG